MLDVDERIRRHLKEIAARDDVRSAEVDDDVAVGVGARDVDDLNAVAVEEVTQLHRLHVKGVGRPRVLRQHCLLTCRRAQMVQRVLVGDDRRALAGVGDVAGDVAAGERPAGFRQPFVPADVVGMEVRINNVANRLRRTERIQRILERSARFRTPSQVHRRLFRLRHALQLPNRVQHLVAHAGEAGVDEQHAVLAD